MNAIIWRIYRNILPKSLRLRIHYFRRHSDYVILHKTVLEYAEDNLYTLNAAPFLRDERSRQAYALGAATESWHGLSIRWRVHVACWAGQHCARLSGDFVECGVNRGGLARAIIDYTDFEKLDKKFYLVDTFSGLVPEHLSDSELKKGLLDLFSYYQQNSEEHVKRTFATFGNVQIIKGAVPEILSMIPTQKVAFVSLDMNCTMPEIKAAEYFWDRLVPGGVILLDDYAQKLHSEQQIAFDHFAKCHGVDVLTLPTGQGLIIKV